MQIIATKKILLAAFLLTTINLAAQNEELRKYIFTVYSTDKDSKVLTTQTGFRAKGYGGIITALHGVLYKDNLYASNENGEYLNLKIGMVDINNDIALLIPNPITPFDNSVGFSINKTKNLITHKEFQVIGHPAGIMLNIKTVYSGSPAIETLSHLIPPKLSAFFSQRNSPFLQIEVLYLEGNLVPGHSGSPLLNSNNEVIGVANGGLNGGSAGISWAIPIGNIIFTSIRDNISQLNQLSKSHPEDLFALETVEKTTPDDTELIRWYTFESKEFHCKVNLPAKPHQKKDTVKTAFGILSSNTIELDQSNNPIDQNIAYSLRYTLLPDSVSSDRKDKMDGFFESAIYGMTNKENITVISKKASDYNDYPGRVVRLQIQNQAIVTARFILVKSRFYMLLVMTQISKDENTDIERFFDSFESE